MSIRDIKEGWLNFIMIKMLNKKNVPDHLVKYIDDRFVKCIKCPFLKNKPGKKSKISITYCGKCGCVFPALILAYRKKCPIGKWNSIPIDILD